MARQPERTAQEPHYCLHCRQRAELLRFAGLHEIREHLTTVHGLRQMKIVEGRDWMRDDADSHLLYEAQLTLEDAWAARFQDRLAAITGVDDFLVDCGDAVEPERLGETDG